MPESRSDQVAGPAHPAAHPPLAPPTKPGPLVTPRRRAGWPTPLGVILVVFGSLAAMHNAFGMIMPLVFDPMLRASHQATGTAPWTTMRELLPWAILSGALGLAIAVLAILAGAALIRRAPRALALCTWWSWSKIAFAIGVGVWTALLQSQLIGSISQAGHAGPPPAFVSHVPIVSAYLGAVWGSALPIITLCVVGTKRARAEIKSWSSRRASPRAGAVAPPIA